jgi:hypothetical protein
VATTTAVTAASTGAGAANGILLSVQVVTGQAGSPAGAVADSVTLTTPQLAFTPSGTGSLVFGALENATTASTFTWNSNTTLLAENPVSAYSVDQAAFVSTSATTAGTPVTLGATAPAEPSGNLLLALCEILSGTGLAIDSSTPAAVTDNTGETVTSASFTPPDGALLVAVVVSNGTGTSGAASSLDVSDTAGLAWTLQASAVYTAGSATEQACGIYTAVVPVPGGGGGIGFIPFTQRTGSVQLQRQILAATLARMSSPTARSRIITASAELAGMAGWSGSGSLGSTGAFGGSAGWSGSGSLASSWTFTGSAGLSGSGTFTSIGGASVSAQLSGSGTLGGARGVTRVQAAGWSGSGTLSAGYLAAQWTGTGTLGVSGLLLSFPAGLSGTGTLGVLKVLGGLVAASSPATVSCAQPGTSQVAVAAPGSSNWAYLGTLGQVTALTYSFVCPGGCDSMTCTVMVPASYRTQLFNPGWKVRITRGGHQVWDGVLDEPVPTSSGWNLTAVGTGNLGTNYLAVYSDTWPAGQPDESINGAIARGLPWYNPGIGQPAGAWFGQAVDSGAQTVTELLNLVCTRGAMTWMVNSQPGGYPGDDLNVFPLPSVVNRLLVCNDPVPRTLGGDINTIWIRYQVSADTTSGSTSVPAVYALTQVQNAASVAAHGVLEAFLDISDAGTATLGAAQQVGQSVLSLYQRASFAGPFTASYGQLLNAGGVPVDPGTDTAGTVVRLLLSDWGMGGEVGTQPIEFIVGSYSYDDFSQLATLVPFQSVDNSLSGLLSLANTLLTPLTVAS